MVTLDSFLKEHYDNATKLNKLEREHTEDVKESTYSGRSPYARDYARVIYSNAFRRQQGKMQLFAVNGKAFHRNRLTHSFEVAQIARGIVDSLKYKHRYNKGCFRRVSSFFTKLDYDWDDFYGTLSVVVETGALVHDIGNPPFGHHGERELDKLTSRNRFEGNAQSVRVLRTLEKKFPKIDGLN